MKRLFVLIAIILLMFLTACSDRSNSAEISSGDTSLNFLEYTNKEDSLSTQEPSIEVQKCTIKSFVVSENTAIIQIEAPETMIFVPFEKITKVNQNDFLFGAFTPFVRYTIDAMTAEMIPVYEYAFLCSYIRDVDGTIFISQDSRRTANFTYLYRKNSSYSEGLKGQINIYEDGELIYSHILYDERNLSLRLDVWFDLNGFFVKEVFYLDDGFTSSHQMLINYSEGHAYNLGHRNILRVPNNTNHILEMDRNTQNIGIWELRIYSLEKMNLDYIIQMPQNAFVNQFLNGRYLIITFTDFAGINFTDFFSRTYLFDLESQEMMHLGSYMFNPVISPDKTHIAFTSPNGTGSHEYMSEMNKLSYMQSGFYIKNLATGETVFYPIIGTGFMYNIINWAKNY